MYTKYKKFTQALLTRLSIIPCLCRSSHQANFAGLMGLSYKDQPHRHGIMRKRASNACVNFMYLV